MADAARKNHLTDLSDALADLTAEAAASVVAIRLRPQPDDRAEGPRPPEGSPEGGEAHEHPRHGPADHGPPHEGQDGPPRGGPWRHARRGPWMLRMALAAAKAGWPPQGGRGEGGPGGWGPRGRGPDGRGMGGRRRGGPWFMRGAGFASGIVWRDGLIVSADDRLPDEGEVSVVLPGGETVAATIAGRDATTDIVLLRVEKSGPFDKLRPAQLATPTLRAGALAAIVGNEGGTPTSALGTIALAGGPWQSMRGGDIDARIELDLDMRRSGEGGLAVDAAGQAFGMAVFGPRGRVLVIPTATIERVAARLASHGRVARGYLGLGLQTVDVAGGGTGTMVMSVDPKGPGAAAGIRQGDILLACNGEAIASVHALMHRLGARSVGQPVSIDLSRAGETMRVTLTVAEKPQNEGQ